MADGGEEQQPAANAPKPFTLSFAAPAKPRPAVPVGGQPDDDGGVVRELIKGVEGGRVATVAPSAAAPPKPKAKAVIPKLENTFQMRPPPPPAAADLTTTDGRFEAAGPETAQADGVTYGLQGRRGGGGGEKASTSRPGGGGGAAPDATRDWEATRLRDDLARLPDAAGLDAYAAMPVEDFGTAMLRGMGWKGEEESRGGGGNGGTTTTTTSTIPPPPVPRPARLGLGATAVAAPPSRSRAKPGDPLPGGGGGPGGAAAVAAQAAAGPPPPPPGVLAPGATASVVAGPHAGLACTVLALEEGGRGGSSSRRRWASVRLTASGQSVRVEVADLEVGGGSGGGRGDRGGREAKRSRRRSSTSRSPPPPPPPSRPWLRPGIVVKIIDKAAGKGRLYLRKAAVVDVPSPGIATLALLPSDASAASAAPPPPGDLLPGMRQAQVETVVPKKPGARVVVVGGPHAGAPGTLLQRSDGGGGVGAVQLEDLEVVRLRFDDFAERAPVGWGGGE